MPSGTAFSRKRNEQFLSIAQKYSKEEKCRMKA